MLFSLTVEGQTLSLKAEVPGEFDLMTTDHIGRLYLTRSHELFQYDAEGKIRYQYSDLSLGEILNLDTRNPLKLLLFYPDFSRITFLDNTLSRTREQALDLTRLDLELAQLACTSFDNGFWVYDPVSFRLIRYGQDLKITNEVSNINQLVGAEINPIQMTEDDSWVYLYDPEHGVFVFDSFGTYSKLIPIIGADRIQVRSNGIFFQMKDGLLKYDLLNFDQVMIDLPVTSWKAIRVEKGRLYLLTFNGVQIYENSK